MTENPKHEAAAIRRMIAAEPGEPTWADVAAAKITAPTAREKLTAAAQEMHGTRYETYTQARAALEEIEADARKLMVDLANFATWHDDRIASGDYGPEPSTSVTKYDAAPANYLANASTAARTANETRTARDAMQAAVTAMEADALR